MSTIGKTTYGPPTRTAYAKVSVKELLGTIGHDVKEWKTVTVIQPSLDSIAGTRKSLVLDKAAFIEIRWTERLPNEEEVKE